MPLSPIDPVIKNLRSLALRSDVAGMTDGQLLEQFVAHHDEAAFAALVGRHGPMIWGVCQRVLRNQHDSEDAFQATFLVLARKAGTVFPRELVGNWLYGVAHTTALRTRALAARQRFREKQVIRMPEPMPRDEGFPNELVDLLDQELKCLPDRFRTVIVLCDLEGRTRREVARQLDIPEGTVSSRLTKGRRLLARKLARHGVAFSVAAIATMLTENAASACMPASLVGNTVKAATAVAAGKAAATSIVSAQVAALTEGVIRTMFVTKLKSVLAAVLVVAVVFGGVGFGVSLGNGAGAVSGPSAIDKAANKDAKAKDERTNHLLKLSPAERMRVLARVVNTDKDFVAAAHGALTETLVERGSLQAAESTDLVCRVRTGGIFPAEPVVITWVIDEGSRVKQGDKLIEFDSSAFADVLRKQRQVVADSEKERKRAEEALERTQRENRIDVKLAEIDLRLAQLALRRYKGDDALQKETLALAVERTGLLVERVKLQGPPRVEKATDLVDARKSVCVREQGRQREVEMNIANCVMRAPRDGVVLYYVPEETRGGGGQQGIVAQGEPVREGQKLLRVSDLKRMAISTLVHESEIHKVRVGQAVKIRVDAFPGRIFTGKVHEVATRASQVVWLRSGKKAYKVIIAIDGDNKDLKPGMSAEPTIIVGERPDCLRMPSSAMLGKGKETFCFVLAGDELHVRKVTTGLSDGALVEIRDGLKEGDRVLRDPGAAIERLSGLDRPGKE